MSIRNLSPFHWYTSLFVFRVPVISRLTQGIVLIVSLSICLPSLASPPWHVFLPFKRVEADPEANYLLTEKDGPWMILATTFAGPGSQQEALELVLELRKRYKMPAYLHKKRFDYSHSVQGLGVDRYGRPKRMKYNKAMAYDEWAVLIGDWDGVDHPGLEKSLKKIKFAIPECMKLQQGERTTQRYADWRALQQKLTGNLDKKKKGPMGHAFVTRNPILPASFFATKGLDKFVVRMNKGVKHSLLNCPGKYTVRVATFRGNVIIDQRKVSEVESGAQMESRLEEAAMKAHRLTEILRERGIEAYEFHDRHESIVTIGNFTSVGEPRPDGKTEINPMVHQIIQTYGAQDQPSAAGITKRPVTLESIPFDVQPLPVLVPRYSIGNDYVQGFLP